MALARARAVARRTKDRWKSKQWYKVVAPAAFSSKILAETFADDPSKLTGRRVEATLFDLNGDMKSMHIKLYFQVSEVLDNQAKTVFDGHTMTSDYVRRLTRRGATKIPAVFDLKCKDGGRIRVKPFAISDRRCQTTQAQAIRQVMLDVLTEAADKNTQTGLMAEILVGDLTNRIYKEARKIHPVRRIEIAKTEILKAPSVELDETPILREPEPEGEGAAVEEGEAKDEGDSEDAGEGVELSGDSEEE